MEIEIDALATPEVLRELLNVEPPENLAGKVMARIAKFNKLREYESHRKSPEETKERNRRWHQENPQRSKGYAVKRRFGISLEEYNTRLALQNNKCALCGKDFYGDGNSGGRPVLDHNHNNESIREFLHQNCNAALGLFEDCIETCRAAVRYLEKHSGD